MENQNYKSENASLHDIKEVSKRTIQFVFLSLIVGMAILPYRVFSGHHVSAMVLSVFCIFLAIVLLIDKKGFTRYTQVISLVGINLFLFVFSYTDGINMGSYLYFFPMLFSIPFLVNNHEKYHKRVVSYFLLVIACMGATFLIAQDTSPFQNIAASEYTISFNINLVCAVLLSAAFSYLNIHFERKYARVLIEQKKQDH